MDMNNIGTIEKATQFGMKDARKLGIVLVFMFFASVVAIFFSESDNNILLIVSVVVGMYMAMNIGANDVANNVGPAVGSNTMSLGLAIVIAAIFEASGAIIAGGDVVDTIRSGIVSQEAFSDINVFISVMLGALIAGALWLNLATFVGAPVSTTHSIVGGLLGSSIAAGGFGIVNWRAVLEIASSWIISPIVGGLIAVIFLYIVKRTITYQNDKKLAAKKNVPILIFIMSWSFCLYLLQKGLSKILYINLPSQIAISFVVAILIFIITKPLINKKVDLLQNTKDSISELFTIPLIFAAALLSFAHGANDVANAIGPLAAINQALSNVMEAKSNVPIWIMVLGGLGISIGLALYGPRLIKTVGSEITELDKMRAFCIALSASITVLVASALGLPVSSTHIAIGAIFGIGFLREYLKSNYKKMEQEIIQAHKGKDAIIVENFLNDFRKASIKQKQAILQHLKENSKGVKLNKKDKKALRKSVKSEIVKRAAMTKIVMAWIVTVPVSAIVGAFCFYVIVQFADKF
ncbi:inorganic phosphate transporter [Helicobacter sp. 16-1353]|uniref:inorganic phosphate transporter n=1 Tax=Helicobacter sp. 16-1353 TaxID=2004996 RepID=UPI000DCCB63C|nr:inorganic phosphate transporter [Helicobacter sp. 16-1353]RAX54946.1 inorganic phosphate transporter [Helicobacter sp. 16-1353]